MTAKSPTPYGSWPSPITTDLVTGSAIQLGEVGATSSALVWVESRPEQGGRSALVYQKLVDGKVADESKAEEVTPDMKWNVRTRCHEYGGGSWGFSGDDLIFSTFEGPVYKTSRTGNGSWSEPAQVTPKSDVLRYADFSAHPTTSSLVLAVVEDHTNDTPAAVVNTVALLDTSTSKIHTVASGCDFYSEPRFSSTGEFISYISWNHPNMPWEDSALWVAKVNRDGDKINFEQPVVEGSAKKIAGQKGDGESVGQARWAEDDTLVFLSDRSGFNELYSWKEGGEVEQVLAELTGSDVGPPAWQFGISTHQPLGFGKWISTAKDGNLRVIDLAKKSSSILSTPYTALSSLQVLSATKVAALAAPADAPQLLAVLDLDLAASAATPSPVKLSSSATVDPDYISVGERIKYPTKGGLEAHAIYFPPANKEHVGVEGELPPLVVYCHGGPTSAAGAGLSWNTVYYTSRGFAWVSVNYGGSSGYGREYRQRLEKNWGVVDVQDTIACVEHLVSTGKVDRKRVSITGGSAGGFTVLAALCAGDVFGAGAAHYGVSDLKMLADDTHKFESQYLYGLLGGTPQEVPDVYRDRSPLNNAANITSPLLLLQGDIDRVVPQEQAILMLEKVKGAGGEAEMIIFEGEGHGFRKAENKKRAMEEELSFFRRTFSIEGGKK